MPNKYRVTLTAVYYILAENRQVINDIIDAPTADDPFSLGEANSLKWEIKGLGELGKSRRRDDLEDFTLIE